MSSFLCTTEWPSAAMRWRGSSYEREGGGSGTSRATVVESVCARAGRGGDAKQKQHAQTKRQFRGREYQFTVRRKSPTNKNKTKREPKTGNKPTHTMHTLTHTHTQHSTEGLCKLLLLGVREVLRGV